MIAEELKPDQDDLAAYKGKWRNLYFLKDGSIVNITKRDGTYCFHDTEQQAIDSSIAWIKFHLDFAKEVEHRGKGIVNKEQTGGKIQAAMDRIEAKITELLTDSEADHAPN